MIPLVNLERQYARLRNDILKVVDEVFQKGAFIQGPYVKAFEEAFLKSHGAAFGAGCSSGTSALTVLLQAHGLQPGDEVITTPHTFFATAESMMVIGLKPVFVDVDPETHCLDPLKIEAAITPRTRAIVPVHIYGNPCDMEAILSIASRHKLQVIEDCAQAHYAKYNGRFVGTASGGAAFSFYPGKNLGAAGDAGFIFSSSEEVNQRVKKIIDHGRKEKYLHDSVGFNHRMDGVQAAILSVKLPEMPKWTARRVELAGRYSRAISARGLRMPKAIPGAEPVFHLFVVEVSNREQVLSALKEKGIQAGIHYPVPLHRQPALTFLGYEGRCPVADRLASRVMSLPICPELTNEEQDHIISTFLEVAEA